MKYFLIFWAVGFIGFSQANESFNNANQLYNSGNYQKAASKYMSIIAADQHSSALYYNLANCHYKLNEIALSIFYYEKALLLNPDDKDIATNLGFAQKMTIDSIQEVPENGLSKLFAQTLNSLSVDGWAVRSVWAWLVCLCCSIYVLFLVLFGIEKKSVFRVEQCYFASTNKLALFMLFKKDSLDRSVRPAIVFATEVEARLEPNLRAETSFSLHEGTKVLVS